jgi:hypothetical protein
MHFSRKKIANKTIFGIFDSHSCQTCLETGKSITCYFESFKAFIARIETNFGAPTNYDLVVLHVQFEKPAEKRSQLPTIDIPKKELIVENCDC